MRVVLLTLVLAIFPQAGIIKGKVKERGGKNLDAVRIIAVGATDETKKLETTSNQSGDFEFKGIPAGDYLLTFEKQGYETFKSQKFSVTAGEANRIRGPVELSKEKPPYAIIRGAVFSGEGFTMRNALVRIEKITEGKKFKSEAVSGDGGEFSFRIPAGKATYRLTATAKGFQTISKDVEIEGDDVRQVSLSLTKEN